MKKTLIALAALAATGAFAQNVTVSGTIDAAYRSAKTEAANGTTVNTSKIGKDAIGTSGFVLSGNEDLGSGLSAVFQYEQNFDATNTGTADASSATGSTLSTGQAFVGLQGGFGSIKLGSANTPSLTVQGGRAGSFGTKDGGRAALTAGGYTTLFGLSTTRYDSSIVYSSPNFSGFSFGLNYAPKSDDGAVAANGALTDIGLFYANGPIAAGVSVFSQDIGGGTAINAATNKNALTSYYFTYDLKFAKFGLGGHTFKADSATANVTDNSGLNLLAEVPLSPALSLTVNLQKLDDKNASDIDSTQSAVGVQYALSKRTTTYARYVTQTADNTGTGATIKSANEILVGLRHNF